MYFVIKKTTRQTCILLSALRCFQFDDF